MAAGKGAYDVAIAGVAATTGGAIASIANPEGVALVITRAVLSRTTKSTGAAAVNIGVGTGATTSYDNLIDGVAAGAAEGAEDNVTDIGSNGKSRQPWPAASFVTVTGESSTAGLVGTLYLEYVRA
ncbi:MAG: hypothetical protein NUW22_13800 [Acidobacteria bacterium]|nr:hypothetical protein [Acidobacteriota bacterium]